MASLNGRKDQRNGHANGVAAIQEPQNEFKLLSEDELKEKASAGSKRAFVELWKRGIRFELELTEEEKQQAEQELRAQNEKKTGNDYAPGIPAPDLFDGPMFPVQPETGDAIWHGLAGDVVNKIAPHTEAHPVGILAQLLTCVGNLVGRNPHWRLGATRHGLNLFVAMVGRTSDGRKGTGLDEIKPVLRGCDETWNPGDFEGGLVSGEGLIDAIRDPVTKLVGKELVVIEPGVEDKRLLIVEREMSTLLAAFERHGNTLSGIIRGLWDGNTLTKKARNCPGRATNPHGSVIAHATPEDLTLMRPNEVRNGFANRFLWVCVQRTRLLPDGGQSHRIDWTDTHRQLKEVLSFCNRPDDIKLGGMTLVRDKEAKELWRRNYEHLSSPPGGAFGAVISRAAPQVMRVASIYAVLDCSTYVRKTHLAAALSFWRYCEDSARYLFSTDCLSDDALKLLDAVKGAGEEGLTQTQIRRQVFGNKDGMSFRIKRAIKRLTDQGFAVILPIRGKTKPTMLLVGATWARKREQLED